MNFYALKLQKIQEAGLFGGTRVVRGKDPDGRAFGAGFFDSTLALQIKIVEKFLAVGGQVVHAEEDGALLHVDIVAGGPFDFGKWRIGAVPFATPVGRTKRWKAPVRAPIAESFIATAGGVVVVAGGGEKE